MGTKLLCKRKWPENSLTSNVFNMFAPWLTKPERVHPVLEGSPGRPNDHARPVLQVDVILILQAPAGRRDCQLV